MAEIFRKGKYMYRVSIEQNEPRQYFLDRGNFIARLTPKSEQEYDEAVRYSRIYINVKYGKCEYSQPIMDRLSFLLNKQG